MRFCTSGGVLWLLFVGCVLTQENRCKSYGDCDPGSNCENPIDPNTGRPKCYGCSDGGFIPYEWKNDGIKDCKNGSDEEDRKSLKATRCIWPRCKRATREDIGTNTAFRFHRTR